MFLSGSLSVYLDKYTHFQAPVRSLLRIPGPAKALPPQVPLASSPGHIFAGSLPPLTLRQQEDGPHPVGWAGEARSVRP